MTETISTWGVSHVLKRAGDIVFARPPHDRSYLQGWNPLAWFWWGLASTEKQRANSKHNGSKEAHILEGAQLTILYGLCGALLLVCAELVKTSARVNAAEDALSAHTPWRIGFSEPTIVPVKSWLFGIDKSQIVVFQDWAQRFDEAKGTVTKHCRATFADEAERKANGSYNGLIANMPANLQLSVIGQTCDLK